MSIVQLSRFFVCVVLFKRQLLYFIKSFCLCQELFYFSLSLFSSFSLPSHATAYLGYHFQNSLSTTFLIYFSIISLIFKSSCFLPIKNVPPPRLLLSSVALLFSLLFLSDECYLITAVFNCQCFLYISCNSDNSESLASAFPNTNRFYKLACNKLIGLGNIGRMPLIVKTQKRPCSSAQSLSYTILFSFQLLLEDVRTTMSYVSISLPSLHQTVPSPFSRSSFRQV